MLVLYNSCADLYLFSSNQTLTFWISFKALLYDFTWRATTGGQGPLLNCGRLRWRSEGRSGGKNAKFLYFKSKTHFLPSKCIWVQVIDFFCENVAFCHAARHSAAKPRSKGKLRFSPILPHSPLPLTRENCWFSLLGHVALNNKSCSAQLRCALLLSSRLPPTGRQGPRLEGHPQEGGHVISIKYQSILLGTEL